MITVAALYVATGGCYFGLDGVDPWDKERDARKYDGPHPVVAHPPLSKREANATPIAFRDALISLARQSVASERAA